MGAVRVEMLGHLRIVEPEAGVDEQINVAGRSHQIWELVVYLILHRDREVGIQELIDKLCPEMDSDDPNATIKNRVSRARGMLGKLGLSDAKNLIRCSNGRYRWVRETALDLDEFERLAGNGDPGAGVGRGMEAVRLYGGDFIPGLAYHTWTASLSAYYHALLVKLALRLLNRLEELGRWNDLEVLARRAFEIDPSVEKFSIYLMRAFTESGFAQKALDHFAQVRQSMMDQYGVAPSPELELAYRETLKKLYGGRLTKSEVRAFLKADDPAGAFYCDCSTFREIVQVNARSMSRSRSDSQLLIITLDAEADAIPERLAMLMKRMELAVSRTLRSGDPFTKLNTCRLLALLPGASPENSLKVVDRISGSFRRLCPKSGAHFSYDFFDLGDLDILAGDGDAGEGRTGESITGPQEGALTK